MIKNLVRAAFSMLTLTALTTSAYPQWVQTSWPADSSFFSLYAGQGMVLARTWDSLNGGRTFFTLDDGTDWTPISAAGSDIDVLSIVMWNNAVLAGTWNGFYRSALSEIHWEPFMPAGIAADTAIWSLARVDGILFAGVVGTIYRSSVADANTWTEAGTGIPVNARVTSIVGNGTAVFAGTDSNGVFVATAGGAGWTAIHSGLVDMHISQLAAVGTRLFAVTLKGVFISDANDTSWTADSSGLKNVNCLLAANKMLFAGTDGDGVHLSVDSGLTWTPFASGMPAGARVWSLAASSDGLLFAGTSSGLWRAPMIAAATQTSTSPDPAAGKTTTPTATDAED